MTLYTIMEANCGYTIPHNCALDRKEAERARNKKAKKYPDRDWWIQPIYEVDKCIINQAEYEDAYNLK